MEDKEIIEFYSSLSEYYRKKYNKLRDENSEYFELIIKYSDYLDKKNRLKLLKKVQEIINKKGNC